MQDVPCGTAPAAGREMTDPEMLDLLEKQITKLALAGANVRQTAEFLWVGEWLLAYEGAYVLNRKHPGILVACDMQALNDYFDEDMSDLD